MWQDFDPLVFQIAQVSKLMWCEYIHNFVDAEEMLDYGASKIPGYASFALEVFHRLYYESVPERLNPLPPESGWAKKLHDEFQEIVGFDSLVEQCLGNQLAAGLATEEYCREIIDALPLPRPRWINPNSLRKAVKQLKQLPNALPTSVFENIINPHDGMLIAKEQQKLKQQMLELIEEALDDSQAMLQLLQRNGKEAVGLAQQYAASLEATQIRQILRSAIASSRDKLELAQEELEMLGIGWGNSDNQSTQLSPAIKMALIQKIASNDKLRQIAKIAGRLKGIADRKRRSKTIDSFGEVTSIELGNNLSRLLPGELLHLADPALFPLFAQGYYDRSLLQYKTKGKQKRSRGPVIVCLDSSGSMQGLPDDWAKAITAVLGQIANQDSRHFRIIHFATQVCRIDDFFPKQHDQQRLLESMLSFYNGGGTDWQPALKAAVKCIEQQRTVFKQADIVIVTDGKCDVESKFVKELKAKKEQLQFSIYGVLIGDLTVTKLSKFCDRVWAVKDLLSQEVVIDELFLL